MVVLPVPVASVRRMRCLFSATASNTSFTAFQSLKELPEEVQGLMQQAIEIRKNAYAPYSNFNVGAAILLEDGKIITGNNQENAAYPSGLCAERVAIFYASSQHPNKKIIAVAVSANSKGLKVNIPVPPCGACRQAMAEYEIKFDCK